MISEPTSTWLPVALASDRRYYRAYDVACPGWRRCTSIAWCTTGAQVVHTRPGGQWLVKNILKTSNVLQVGRLQTVTVPEGVRENERKRGDENRAGSLALSVSPGNSQNT
jgi:hypothetical protein